MTAWESLQAYGDERDMTVCMKAKEVSVWHDCVCVYVRGKACKPT